MFQNPQREFALHGCDRRNSASRRCRRCPTSTTDQPRENLHPRQLTAFLNMSSLDELEEKMQAWGDLERAALHAEDAAWMGGHLPEARALAKSATELRRRADEALNAILAISEEKAPSDIPH